MAIRCHVCAVEGVPLFPTPCKPCHTVVTVTEQKCNTCSGTFTVQVCSNCEREVPLTPNAHVSEYGGAAKTIWGKMRENKVRDQIKASARYLAVVALLDDPLNRACVLREIARRGPIQLLLPPIQRQGGGWVFLTLRESMRNLRPNELKSDADTESVYEIHPDEGRWFISIVEEDLELGPFDSKDVALIQLKLTAKAAGYKFLDKVPWTNKDLTKWPIG